MEPGNLNHTRFTLTNQRFLLNVNERRRLSSASAPSLCLIYLPRSAAPLAFILSRFSSHKCIFPPLHTPPPLKNMPLPRLCSFIQLLRGHVRSFICKVTGCASAPLQDAGFCRRRNRSPRPGRVLRLAEHGHKHSRVTLSRRETVLCTVYTFTNAVGGDMVICAAFPLRHNIQFKGYRETPSIMCRENIWSSLLHYVSGGLTVSVTATSTPI